MGHHQEGHQNWLSWHDKSVRNSPAGHTVGQLRNSNSDRDNIRQSSRSEILRKRIKRTDKDPPKYTPALNLGNRFCSQCGVFRPMGGSRCPFCFIETGGKKQKWQEENLSDETKEVLKAYRARRREEAKQEKLFTQQVKKLMSLDPRVKKSYYTQAGQKALRARQVAWLIDQIELMLKLFEPNELGSYTLYSDELMNAAPALRALKREIPRLKKTIYKNPENVQRGKEIFERNRLKKSGAELDLNSPFDRASYIAGLSGAAKSNRSRNTNKKIHDTGFIE